MCCYKIKELKLNVLLSIFAIIKHAYPMCSAYVGEYWNTVKI